MASQDDPIDWSWAAMEPEPTDAERALLDNFASQYLLDNNAAAAASRCGFAAAFAQEYGNRFITKAYVQRRLQYLRDIVAEEKVDAKYDRQLTLTVLREVASNKGQPGAARVAAVTKLMNYHGFDAPTKSEKSVTHKGGVIMVPAIANLDEWEAAAQASQSNLANASRV